MSIKNIYEQIIADGIRFEKAKHGHYRNWKPNILLGFTAINAFNFFTIILWSNFLLDKITGKSYPVFVDIEIFPWDTLDTLLSGLITLFIPFVTLNYFLIFYNKRYEKILEKYEYKNGKWYQIYIIASILIAIVPGFLVSILSK